MKKIIILTLCKQGYTLLKALVLPKKAKELLQIADKAYNNKQYQGALFFWQKAKTYLKRYNEDLYFKMGITYQHLGNNDQAITCMQKAARLGDKEAQGFLNSNGISW